MSSTNNFYLRPKQRPQEPTSYDIISPSRPLGKIYPGRVMNHLTAKSVNVSSKSGKIESQIMLKRRIEGLEGISSKEVQSVVGPTGPTGARGPRGFQGVPGPVGPSQPVQWVQLFDNFNQNIITSDNTFLTLSIKGIDNNYNTGDFQLKSEKKTNDTLLLASSGSWYVSITFKYNFTYNTTYSGKTVYPTFEVLYNNQVVYVFQDTSIVGNDESFSFEEKCNSASFVVSSASSKPKLKIRYTNGFDFNYASDSQLKVEQLIVICQKL
jgi:hypothetical protein